VGKAPVEGTQKRYLARNRELWDSWTELHEESAFYDLAGFRAGASSLKEIELAELGDIDGKSLIHLQCHFGLDTLSLARLGARVTGVDFSRRAIDLATGLAEELEIPARFICSDIYDISGTLSGQFDIVFTSYGVLWWLPDLRRWAELIEELIVPGGIFYMVEFHPFLSLLDDDGRGPVGSYFSEGGAVRYEARGSYAVAESDQTHECFGWAHSMSEIIGELTEAGLVLEFFRERAYSPFPCFPFLEESEPGRFALRGTDADVPILFSLRARKP
jgi:SAM-dependent methyltransferase